MFEKISKTKTPDKIILSPCMILQGDEIESLLLHFAAFYGKSTYSTSFGLYFISNVYPVRSS